MTINESMYKGLKCIVMESEMLKVVILPELGSKIASIINKATGREFVYQREKDYSILPNYGEPFNNYDLSGIDEMFPTVIECHYPDGVWMGTLFPDHGEVWTQRWDYSIEDNDINMWVCGVRLPYKLKKKLYFLTDKVLRIDYELQNLCNIDFSYIWCLHPLLNCSTDTRIILPKSVIKIINTRDFSDRLGNFGEIHEYPETTDINGKRVRLDEVGSRDLRLCEKFFNIGRVDEGWCAVKHCDTEEVLGLSYPVDKIPYLGYWISEGGLNGHYHVAPEPATGAFDRIDTAKQWNMLSDLKGKGSEKWYVNITIDNKSIINGIDEVGRIS